MKSFLKIIAFCGLFILALVSFVICIDINVFLAIVFPIVIIVGGSTLLSKW